MSIFKKFLLEQNMNTIKKEIVYKAQQIYDDWNQEDGIDDIYGSGGICDEIARSIGNIMVDNGYNVKDGWDDEHAFMIAYNKSRAYIVDIPPEVYETGYGYKWKKKKNVKFKPSDVYIEEIPIEDIEEE